MIVIETTQLRSSAESMEGAASTVEELARVLAYDVTGLPAALGAWSADAVAGAASELRAIAQALRLEGSLLVERAASVEAEQAAASSASGPGAAGNVVNGVVYLNADGTPFDVSGLPLSTYSTIGGEGITPTFVVNAGSGSSILPEFTVTPGAGPGLSTPLDADFQAAADRMAAGILGAATGGGAGADVGMSGGQTIVGAMDNGTTAIVGGGRNVYEGPMGTRSTGYPGDHDGEVPTDGLAIGDS